MSQSDANLLERLNDVIAKARTAGADAADLVYAEGTSVAMTYRLGKPENLDRAEGTMGSGPGCRGRARLLAVPYCPLTVPYCPLIVP